ncbi:cation transporter [Rhodohalobacter sp. SW132]|uniref:cation diffusion facilitator family transporter n=1 Tax=Rhodohalobacter sp. SW132 TaxID=2293433 RepID=UPI000E261BEB|nr:cation diffusion facilitator family transporter [Rhodohalobacter sp. SW132]REL38965.1 cation transporter [Rhodohalobacter sp. SW132]
MATFDEVKRALLISLFVSLFSLSLKIAAFVITDSTAALSDAAESVVHLFAVLFVVYGYYLSIKPADEDHHYGHERVEFLSVGAEGAIIIVAGLSILYHAFESMITGIEIVNMGAGIILLVAAALINLVLGSYVLRIGRKHDNMIAVSNGKHTLTDVWTSGGVVIALVIIHFTGWLFIDVIVSLLIAGYIMYEAYKLLSFSVKGLMDTRNPSADSALTRVLNEQLPDKANGWHHLRHRTSGNTTWIEFHLVFDDEINLKDAHDEATILERKLIDSLKTDAIITIHLEPDEAHDESHTILKGANKKKDLDEFA